MSIAPTHPAEPREDARNLYYNGVPGWMSEKLEELAFDEAEMAFDDPDAPDRLVYSNEEFWCMVVVAMLSDDVLDEQLAAFETAVEAAGGLVMVRDGVDRPPYQCWPVARTTCPRCSEQTEREERPERTGWAVCWYVACLPKHEVRRLVEETLGPL